MHHTCTQPRHGVPFPRERRYPCRIRRRTRGFTLLELIVVVVIVGIAAGMGVFQIGNYRDQVHLRQGAEKIHQIMGWAKLQAEKSGDTVIVRIALPRVSVWRDLDGSGKWESTDRLLLSDSVHPTVVGIRPAAAPAEASVAVPAGAMVAGTGTCGGTTCCTAGSATNPTWADGDVNFCARTSPPLAPFSEDGAVYLGSSNTSVKERWAVVLNGARSADATFWTSEKAPAAATDWRKIR